MDAASISLAGMNAATLGMAVTSNNVANANSKDFRSKRLELEETAGGGVKAAGLRESGTEPVPGGSNVDLATEFTNMLAYADTYKINAKVLEVQQEILGTVMDLKA